MDALIIVSGYLYMKIMVQKGRGLKWKLRKICFIWRIVNKIIIINVYQK